MSSFMRPCDMRSNASERRPSIDSRLVGLMSRYLRRWRGMMMSASDDHAAPKSIEESGSGERKTMYATILRCVFCDAEYPLIHRGPCTRCARPGEESALHETLAVQYD